MIEFFIKATTSKTGYQVKGYSYYYNTDLPLTPDTFPLVELYSLAGISLPLTTTYPPASCSPWGSNSLCNIVLSSALSRASLLLGPSGPQSHHRPFQALPLSLIHSLAQPWLTKWVQTLINKPKTSLALSRLLNRVWKSGPVQFLPLKSENCNCCQLANLYFWSNWNCNCSCSFVAVSFQFLTSYNQL